jgi:hypothetical protein
MLLRRVALPLLFSGLVTVLGASAAACSSSKDDPAATPPSDVPEAGTTPNSEAGTTPDGGKEETAIVFDKSTTFAKRDCTLTVAYAGRR